MRFLLFFAFALSTLQLHARTSYSEAILDEIRLELADVKHELKSAQVELNLLDERVRKSTSKPVAKPDPSPITALEKKIAHLESLLEKATQDLRMLSTHTTETLNKINALQSEVASHEKRLDEVAKLKGTLTSISQAIGSKTPSKTYRVKSGDSLEKIARSNHMTIDSLKKLNQLKSDKIVIGQELKVSDE